MFNKFYESLNIMRVEKVAEISKFFEIKEMKSVLLNRTRR